MVRNDPKNSISVEPGDSLPTLYKRIAKKAGLTHIRQTVVVHSGIYPGHLRLDTNVNLVAVDGPVHIDGTVTTVTGTKLIGPITATAWAGIGAGAVRLTDLGPDVWVAQRGDDVQAMITAAVAAAATGVQQVVQIGPGVMPPLYETDDGTATGTPLGELGVTLEYMPGAWSSFKDELAPGYISVADRAIVIPFCDDGAGDWLLRDRSSGTRPDGGDPWFGNLALPSAYASKHTPLEYTTGMGIPWTLGIITPRHIPNAEGGLFDDYQYPTYANYVHGQPMTNEQLAECVIRGGFELASHSWLHSITAGDMAVAGADKMEREIIKAKQLLRGLTVELDDDPEIIEPLSANIAGFIAPGGWTGENSILTAKQLQNSLGRIVARNYAWSRLALTNMKTASMYGSPLHGWNKYEINLLTAASADVDAFIELIQPGQKYILLVHHLGDDGVDTQFKYLVDQLAAKVAAGELECVTASTGFLGTPTSDPQYAPGGRMLWGSGALAAATTFVGTWKTPATCNFTIDTVGADNWLTWSTGFEEAMIAYFQPIRPGSTHTLRMRVRCSAAHSATPHYYVRPYISTYPSGSYMLGHYYAPYNSFTEPAAWSYVNRNPLPANGSELLLTRKVFIPKNAGHLPLLFSIRKRHADDELQITDVEWFLG